MVHFGTDVIRSSGARRVITIGGRAVNVIDTTLDVASFSNEIAREAMGDNYLGYADELRAYTEAVLNANRDNHETIEISDLVNKLNTGISDINSKIETIVNEMSQIDALHEKIYNISTTIGSALPPNYNWINSNLTETRYFTDTDSTNSDQIHIQADHLVIGVSSVSMILTGGLYGYKAYRRRRNKVQPELVATGNIETLSSRIKRRMPVNIVRGVNLTKKVIIPVVQLAGLVGTVFSLYSFIQEFRQVDAAKRQLREGAQAAKETSIYLKLVINGCSDNAEVDKVAHFFNIGVDSSPDGRAARVSLKQGLGNLQTKSASPFLRPFSPFMKNANKMVSPQP
jgi:outer membrane murein-binding lipoprotein Lpp